MSLNDPVIGREIGSYRVLSLLGRGGMGKVYLAQHPRIGKKVAIKLLKAEYSEHPQAVQRFFHEAKAVNDIRHHNVIDILDFGKTPEGECYILMEHLEGETLTQIIQASAPLPKERIAHISLQICSALSAAHDLGIIHRDLKSDNIFLTTHANQADFVKILDFGIAKLLYEQDTAALQTSAGLVMGTPLYMAPEQALGHTVDPQTDVYALGVLMYFMATKSPPFFDPNPVALAHLHVNAEVVPPTQRNPDLDPRLEKVILGCLEKHKDDRYRSMREVADALGEACDLDITPYFTPVVTSTLTLARRKLSDSQRPPSDPSLMVTSIPETESRRGGGKRAILATLAFALLGGASLYLGFFHQGNGQSAIPTESITATVPVSAPASQPADSGGTQPATTQPATPAPQEAASQPAPQKSKSSRKTAKPQEKPSKDAEPRKPIGTKTINPF